MPFLSRGLGEGGEGHEIERLLDVSVHAKKMRGSPFHRFLDELSQDEDNLVGLVELPERELRCLQAPAYGFSEHVQNPAVQLVENRQHCDRPEVCNVDRVRDFCQQGDLGPTASLPSPPRFRRFRTASPPPGPVLAPALPPRESGESRDQLLQSYR